MILAAVLLLTGCAIGRVPENKQQNAVNQLCAELHALAPTVSEKEAYRVADVAVRYPLSLAKENHVIRPAIINNILVNTGVHPRGLCFQWADDLTVKLLTLHLRTLELHRGVAELGNRHEHSCVVVTAIGQDFNEGIVLDAWRDGGWLCWARVPDDKYKWEEVELDYVEELQVAAKKLEADRK